MVEAYKEKIFDPNFEQKRLADIYPARISACYLAKVISNIDGTPRVLDVGSGSNPTMAYLVQVLGGDYIGLDLDPYERHLKKLQKDGVERVVKGDVLHLPMSSEGVEVSHTRTVLAFFNPEIRSGAIEEILSVTGNTAIFIEHDYKNVDDWEGVAAELRDPMLETLKGFGFDPYCGAGLEGEIRDCLKNQKRIARVEVDRTLRQPGNYYAEMYARIEELVGIARNSGNEKNVEILQSILQKIDSDEKRERLPHFSTPEMVAVVVDFQDRPL